MVEEDVADSSQLCQAWENLTLRQRQRYTAAQDTNALFIQSYG